MTLLEIDLSQCFCRHRLHGPPRSEGLSKKLENNSAKVNPLALVVPGQQKETGYEMILHFHRVSSFGREACERVLPKKGKSIDIGMNIK